MFTKPKPWAVLVSVNQNKSKSFELLQDKVSVGRSTFNTYVVTDVRVSQKHLIIERSLDGKVYLTDYSSHGTYVNGVLCNKEESVQHHS